MNYATSIHQLTETFLRLESEGIHTGLAVDGDRLAERKAGA